jgi:hypothetical protein
LLKVENDLNEPECQIYEWSNFYIQLL